MAFSFSKPAASTPMFGAAQGGGAFASTQNQSNSSSGPTQPGSTLFGAKPAGTSLFGGAPASGANNSGGLFGASQNNTQTPAQQQGGLFGSQSTTSTGQTGTGLFGSQQPQQQSGGLFGNQQTQQQGSGLFGGQQQQQQQQQGGGLFGNQQPQQQSGGLFGGQQQQQQQPQQQQGGGLFGNQQPQQQSGGLFGSQQQQQPQQGGLFGSQQQQQPQQGGLFGNQQPQQQQGGIFGASTAAPTQPSGGLFGAGSTSQTSQGGLFGSQSKPAGGLFGSTTQAPSAQGGLFGASQSAPLQNAPPSGQAAQPGIMSASQAPSSDPKLGAPLNAQLERIAASWDTSNLTTCQFQQYLYNRAPEGQSASQYHYRRPDAVGPMHDALWNKALRENPEPDRLYPVLAVGFGDLQQRANAQVTEAARQRAKMAELAKQLQELQQKHDLSNVVRTQKVMASQMRLHQRLLSVMKDTATLVPALRGQSLTESEDEVKAALEKCESQLNGAVGDYAAPASEHARLRAHLNELWAQLGVVRAKREALQSQGRMSGSMEWVVVDDASFDEVTQILASLQQGLAHLTTTLSSDAKALDTVCDGLRGVPLVGVRHR